MIGGNDPWRVEKGQNMGVEDRFMKKNSDKIPAGENVSAAIIAEPKGGAWKRGLQAGGRQSGLIGAVATSAIAGKIDTPETGHSGDVASWPDAPAFWIVLTDKQMHVFGGRVGSNEITGGTSYSWDRVADIKVDKKLFISKLDISFKDGTSLELGLAKQKLQPFIEATQARFPS